eukprot:6203824-Pleurochrysis_carterae.AAC.1
MWDRADIPKISHALPICMALAAGSVLSGDRQTTYISRWALRQVTLLMADLLRGFPSAMVAGCVSTDRCLDAIELRFTTIFA